jgi:hypothetical protein
VPLAPLVLDVLVELPLGVLLEVLELLSESGEPP